MSFNHIVKLFSSDRTHENGKINYDYTDVEKENNEQYETWKHMQNPYTVEPNILHMDKKELVEYARDMYGLKCAGMNSSNIVKKLYEHVNGVEKSNRGRKKSTT